MSNKGQPPSLRRFDEQQKQRAREQIAATKMTPEQAIIAAIKRKLDRLQLNAGKVPRAPLPGGFPAGNDDYTAQQFADEVRDLLERPR